MSKNEILSYHLCVNCLFNEKTEIDIIFKGIDPQLLQHFGKRNEYIKRIKSE